MIYYNYVTFWIREIMTMKRMLAVILTSCMIAGLVSPAGAGVMTEIRANTEAALNNLSASNERTEVAAEGADNFDQTIRDLYDNSMSVTDEEIIASAQMMNSDFEAVESEMGEDATAVIDYKEQLYFRIRAFGGRLRQRSDPGMGQTGGIYVLCDAR